MSFWNKLPDTYKILMTMLFLIMTIQLSTLVYIWTHESKVLLEKEEKNLYHQLHTNAELLQTHLESLLQEVTFLSRLEVMDDIMVKDIDKRIMTILKKKSEDFEQGIVLFATSSDETVIASSLKNYNKENFVEFSVVVKASFNTNKRIGRLILLYPLKNLVELDLSNPFQQLWLTPPFKNSIFIEPRIDESIVVSQKLDGILNNWILSLSHKKQDAFMSINEIQTILFLGFIFSFFSLLFVVWILSKKQIEILEYTQEVLALKRTFLSTMSHELRTPLSSILNLTQHLMVNPKIDDRDVEMLRGIENSSEHLLSMINTLLQLSKLESNTMQINKEFVDIRVLLEEIIEIVEPLIDEKNLILKKEFFSSRKIIITDVNIFRQVLINLLSNAIKFTNEGKISITLQEGKNFIELSVIDSGIGIDKEKQTLLFSEFYQAHMGENDIKHSTGLGLALSQKMAKLINGKITIESEGKGKGTKAIFRFSSF